VRPRRRRRSTFVVDLVTGLLALAAMLSLVAGWIFWTQAGVLTWP
jgi:hypothetical protein